MQASETIPQARWFLGYEKRVPRLDDERGYNNWLETTSSIADLLKNYRSCVRTDFFVDPCSILAPDFSSVARHASSVKAALLLGQLGLKCLPGYYEINVSSFTGFAITDQCVDFSWKALRTEQVDRMLLQTAYDFAKCHANSIYLGGIHYTTKEGRSSLQLTLDANNFLQSELRACFFTDLVISLPPPLSLQQNRPLSYVTEGTLGQTFMAPKPSAPLDVYPWGIFALYVLTGKQEAPDTPDELRKLLVSDHAADLLGRILFMDSPDTLARAGMGPPIFTFEGVKHHSYWQTVRGATSVVSSPRKDRTLVTPVISVKLLVIKTVKEEGDKAAELVTLNPIQFEDWTFQNIDAQIRQHGMLYLTTACVHLNMMSFHHSIASDFDWSQMKECVIAHDHVLVFGQSQDLTEELLADPTYRKTLDLLFRAEYEIYLACHSLCRALKTSYGDIFEKRTIGEITYLNAIEDLMQAGKNKGVMLVEVPKTLAEFTIYEIDQTCDSLFTYRRNLHNINKNRKSFYDYARNCCEYYGILFKYRDVLRRIDLELAVLNATGRNLVKKESSSALSKKDQKKEKKKDKKSSRDEETDLRECNRRLCQSCQSGDLEQVKEFLNYEQVKHFVNECDENGVTPLHCAVTHGQTDVVKELLKCPSIDVDVRMADGSTALHAACAGYTRIGYQNRYVALTAILLFYGANSHIKNENNMSCRVLSEGFQGIANVFKIYDADGSEGLRKEFAQVEFIKPPFKVKAKLSKLIEGDALSKDERKVLKNQKEKEKLLETQSRTSISSQATATQNEDVVLSFKSRTTSEVSLPARVVANVATQPMGSNSAGVSPTNSVPSSLHNSNASPNTSGGSVPLPETREHKPSKSRSERKPKDSQKRSDSSRDKKAEIERDEPDRLNKSDSRVAKPKEQPVVDEPVMSGNDIIRASSPLVSPPMAHVMPAQNPQPQPQPVNNTNATAQPIQQPSPVANAPISAPQPVTEAKKDTPNKPLATWTLDELVEYFEKDSVLTKFAHILREEDIDGEVLASMSADELKALNFSFGASKKVQVLLQAHK